MAGISILNLTRRKAPRLPFRKAAKTILPGWDLSLVFVNRKEASALNKKLRKKAYAPNVLSYKVGKRSGEIIICPEVADTQASSYSLSPLTYLLYLFIHGCLHLEGYPHGSTMERREQELLAKLAKGFSRLT